MPRAEEAIILVGGLGTRLRGEVADLPKPLAPVAGRPFLAYLLDQLSGAGIRRLILATGYRSEQIEKVIGGHWRGAEVVYSVEDEPLGTGGAIAHAARILQGEAAFVANGDTFLRFELAAMEECVRRAGAALAMALAAVPDVARYGAVELQEAWVKSFREKGESGPGLINAGAYLLTPEALSVFPPQRKFSFEIQVLQPLTHAGRVVGHAGTEGFIDIGVPADYRSAQQMFSASK